MKWKIASNCTLEYELKNLDKLGFELLLVGYLDIIFHNMFRTFLSLDIIENNNHKILKRRHDTEYNTHYFQIDTISDTHTFEYHLSFTFTETKGFFFFSIERFDIDDIRIKETLVDTWHEIAL